jgi:hypothetical protein
MGASRSTNSSSTGQMVYAPVAMARNVRTGRIPNIKSNGSCTHITHSEFFANVTSTTDAYTVTSYACNPGVASLFPWLSQVAQRFETYKFRYLQFQLHTRAITSQVGTIGLVFDFDAQDPAPTSQMEALSYHDRTADSPWKGQSVTLDLTSGDRLPIRYTRVGLPSGISYDLKTLDLGNLHVFTDGVLASANLGILEVSYSLDLYTPQIQNGIGGRFYNTVGGLDATHLVGTVANFLSDPQANAPFVVTSTSVLTFNQKFEGLVTYSIGGTVLSADFAPVVASGDISSLGQIVNAGATAVFGAFRVRAQPGTTLTPTITATTVTSVQYFIGAAAYTSLN